MEDRPTTEPRWRNAREKVLGVILTVRDEAERLPALFTDIARLADELVVVDTGSTDSTPAVCEAWGARVMRIPWHDDFAEAHNHAIEAASAPYLLWLDAGERVPAEAREKLAALRDGRLAAGADRAFGVVVVKSRPQGGDTIALETRLFPNRAGVRFRNPIAERIDESLADARIEIEALDVAIRRASDGDAAAAAEKAVREGPALLRALAGDPSNPHLMLRLAQALAARGRETEAEEIVTRALTASADAPARFRAGLHLLRSALRKRTGYAPGAKLDLEDAAAADPDWGLPALLEAEAALAARDWDTAGALLDAARKRSFAPGTIPFPLTRARSNVELFTGLIAQQQGDGAAALPCFEAALHHDPSNVDARLELGRALLRQGAAARAREVLEPAGADPAAVSRFVDVSTATGLARVMTGDAAGAAACLAPLLDVFAAELDYAEEVGPLELADALSRTGHGKAAAELVTLFRHTAVSA